MIASATEIGRFFSARSVAVVGASRTPGKAGNVQIRNLMQAFSGRIVPVNPQATEILGLPCFPRLEAIPEPVDLAILLVPANRVLGEVDSCVRCGVRAILVPSAGFAESGTAGRALQQDLVHRARKGGARIWGPNCNGLVDAHRGLWASFSELHGIYPGGVGVIAHTGIFAAGFLNQLMEVPAFGVSKVATLGNSSDVTAAEVLNYLGADQETKAIAVHLEGLIDGRAFFETCMKVAARKPVVVLPAGLSRSGALASQTHTANLAADTQITTAALRQAGAYLVDEFEEMAALASHLAIKGRRASGRSVSVLSTSGGAGVLATDHLSKAGLDIATLGGATLDRLRSLHPSLAVRDAPLDVWPAMERLGPDGVVRDTLACVLDDPAVDSALLLLGAFSGGGSAFNPAVLERSQVDQRKAVVAWLYGPATVRKRWTEDLARLGIPVAANLRSAAVALAAMKPNATFSSLPGSDNDAARLSQAMALVAEARRRGQRFLNEPQARCLVGIWGLVSPLELQVSDPAQAGEAAREIGFPVTLKIVAAELSHKSAVGGVTLGVRSARAVVTAAREIVRRLRQCRPDVRPEGFLVQEMIGPGDEAIFALTLSSSFGSVVLFGQGGTEVEAEADVAFRVAPLETDEAMQLIKETRFGRALCRSRPQSAENLARVLARFSSIPLQQLGIDEIEVNPLRLPYGGGEPVALDGVVVLRPEGEAAVHAGTAPGAAPIFARMPTFGEADR